MPESSQPWAPDGVAFCWQPKAALHRIRNRLESVAGVSSGLAVYVALSEIASDRRSAVFQSTHAYIAQRSGLSVRTVQQRVKDLAEIGLLRYTVPTLKAPAEYELLTVSDEQSFPRVPQPLPSDAKQLPDDEQSLPSVRQPPKTGIVADILIIGKESHKNEGKKLPPISVAQQRVEWDRELGRIERELQGMGKLNDYDKGSKKYNRHVELTTKQTELRKILGVVA